MLYIIEAAVRAKARALPAPFAQPRVTAVSQLSIGCVSIQKIVCPETETAGKMHLSVLRTIGAARSVLCVPMPNAFPRESPQRSLEGALCWAVMTQARNPSMVDADGTTHGSRGSVGFPL